MPNPVKSVGYIKCYSSSSPKYSSELLPGCIWLVLCWCCLSLVLCCWPFSFLHCFYLFFGYYHLIQSLGWCYEFFYWVYFVFFKVGFETFLYYLLNFLRLRFFLDFLSCFIWPWLWHFLSEDLGLFVILTLFLFLNHLYVLSFLSSYIQHGIPLHFWLWTICLYLWFLDVNCNLFLVWFFVNALRIFALCEMFCYELLLMQSLDSLMV